MNTITLSKELIKIIMSGDEEYAGDYYDRWCKGIEWSRNEATEIILACGRARVLDPNRFGAQILPHAIDEEHITYEWNNTE